VPRSTQTCIPPGLLNRVPASVVGKGRNITSVRWQVTLYDHIWHVSSSSSVAMLHCKLLYPCGDAFPIEGVLVATYLLSVEALPHCRCGVANKSYMV